MRTNWDIFCSVVDNYGDIGIAWRLARGLAGEHGLDVRLWVDDLNVFHRIWPAIDAAAAEQSCEGVTVCAWRTPFAAAAPAQVVIDAFGCSLPEAYLAAMSEQSPPPVWINLEYLSAEPWVAEHHGLPSPHPGDDAASEASLRPRELLEKIDAEIKGLEQEKEQMQAELVSVETRFVQEGQSR